MNVRKDRSLELRSNYEVSIGCTYVQISAVIMESASFSVPGFSTQTSVQDSALSHERTRRNPCTHLGKFPWVQGVYSRYARGWTVTGLGESADLSVDVYYRVVATRGSMGLRPLLSTNGRHDGYERLNPIRSLRLHHTGD